MEQSPLKELFQIRCPLHPDTISDILHITQNPSNNTNHRACVQCLLNGNVPIVSALYLKTLFQDPINKDNLLNFYPPLSDSKIYCDLQSILQFTVDNELQHIEQYLDGVKLQFNDILDSLKKESIISLQILQQQQTQILNLYQSLCETDKLKKAIIEASESSDQQKNLHEIIVGKCQDAEINSKKLIYAINQFQENQSKFSMQKAAKSSQKLLRIMKEITFFTSRITPLSEANSILPYFSLVPSTKWDTASRTVISKKENNQLDIKCLEHNGNVCAFYSQNILDNNMHYCFRFAFHQESKKGPPQFQIGLINEADKNKPSGNIFRYTENNFECSINKIIKGKPLNSAFFAKNVHKELEMRVHLASQTVKVADFPNYNNVVELADKNKIKLGCNYNLFIELAFKGNHITLTDVIVSDEFDKKM